MKLAPLLLFFPLLYPVHALAARPLAKPQLRADGRYEFRDNGKPTRFRIANDELQRTGSKGERKITISAKDHLRKVQDDAKRLTAFDERVEMVAYQEGKPEIEAHRRIVTSKVAVTLDEGMDPTALGLSAGAKTMRDVFYSPMDYIMEFEDAAEALTAAEALKSIPGVRNCTVLLASKIAPQFIPNDPFWIPSPGAPVYANDIGRDLADLRAVLTPRPVIFFSGTARASQWYLNRDVTLAYTDVFALSKYATYKDAELPPFVEPEADQSYPRYFDQLVDINVIPAWDLTAADGSLIDGTGVRVAVMDDGVQINPIHPDLNSLRIDTKEDYNFLDGNPSLTSDPRADNPTPPFQIGGGPNHGTAVAGLIVARRDNSRGMTGIAPDSTLIAYRIIGAYVSPDRFADAMVWGTTVIPPQVTGTNPFGLRNGNEWRRGEPSFHISNNSWGRDLGPDIYNADPYLRKALAYGVREGRLVDGVPRGVIYVIAAGNQGEKHGDSNMDAITNNIYTIAVGGISDIGRRISYSNVGAAVRVVAPTGGDELAPRIQHPTGTNLIPALPLVVPGNEKARAAGWTLTPDDWDHPNAITRNSQQILSLDVPKSTSGIAGYNPNFNGTSASCPIVSGVIALMLEANPTLGWRDVQEIIMRSAVVVDPMYGEWSYNNISTPMSHKYGAGLVDALHAVQMAKVWRNLGPRFGQEGSFAGTVDFRETKGDVKVVGANRSIPDNSFGNPIKSDVTFQIPSPAAGLRVEHVVVRLKIRHGRRGDLGIALIAPKAGQADAPVESFLFVPHREDANADIGLPDEPDTGGDRDVKPGEYYDFVSVRHWGVGPQNPALDSANTGAGGEWSLKIWDNTSQAKQVLANPTAAKPEDRIAVSVDNPTSASSRVEYVAVIYHGSASESENEAPVIANSAFLGRANNPFEAKMIARTDLTLLPDGATPRAPITDYRVRVIGASTPSTPEMIIAPSTLAEYNVRYPATTPLAERPFLRFDRTTGILTNAPYPDAPPPPPPTVPPTIPIPLLRPLSKGVWQLELRATNIFGVTRRLIPLTVAERLTYPEWRFLFFTAQQLLDPKISGDGADPDFDGLPNKLEYGVGGQPFIPNPTLLPVISVVGNNLIFEYQVDTGAVPPTVLPQVSSDLSPLSSWTTVTWVETRRDGDLSFRRVTVPIVPGTRKFIRLSY